MKPGVEHSNGLLVEGMEERNVHSVSMGHMWIVSTAVCSLGGDREEGWWGK